MTMTKEQIFLAVYRILRAAGLTHEAALAMEGNWLAESRFDAFRVEGDHTDAATTSHAYVAAVASGTISRETFASDGKGFGLAQWTYFNRSTGRGRKLNLWDFWKRSGKALDDPTMQADFAVWELRNEPEFSALLPDLKSSDNLYYLTDLICKKYEKPAFNNVQVRYSDAQQIGAILASKEMQEAVTQDEPDEDQPDTAFWPPRMLCLGMIGSDVQLLQSLLSCHGHNPGGCTGVFNSGTEKTLRAFQEFAAITVDGVAGRESFTALGLAPGIFD